MTRSRALTRWSSPPPRMPMRTSSGPASRVASRRSARSRWPMTWPAPSPSRARSRRPGVPFQIGFQRRFDAGYQEARRLVASGELGTLYAFRLAGHDPAPPHEAYIPHLGRPLPGLLGPRLRRHPLADRHRGRGGLRDGLRSRLPDLRQVRRRGHGRGDPDDGRWDARRDDHRPPRSARLRHPRRAVRESGQRLGRARPADADAIGRARRATAGRARRGATSSAASTRRTGMSS